MQPEIVLNEFGELSRKARRELIAQGIDPDTAVIEHIHTQSIPIIVDGTAPLAAPLAAPTPVERVIPVPEARIELPLEVVQRVREDPVFSPSLSRRDMRNLRERSENTSEIPVVDADDVVVVFDVVPDVVPQVTQRSYATEITQDYEPFSFSTMSTQSTGIIPTTGSALILPTLPEHHPGALSSFTHTGEIYRTGSISLPSGIGQYGADVLSLDTSEIDIIADDEDVSTSQDLAPIRASSAVSAYSTSNTGVAVPSKFRDRLPLVLAITAAGLAVGVVALFITGYVLGVF